MRFFESTTLSLNLSLTGSDIWYRERQLRLMFIVRISVFSKGEFFAYFATQPKHTIFIKHMSSSGYASKSEFVDDFSLKIEELGHPRIYGQILGWLLICEPPHQSFSDLMENLHISKASVSNTTRILIERGLIKKIRLKGERQMYFQLKEGSLMEFMEKQMQLTLDLEKITEKGLKLAEEDEATDSERLKKANDFHRFLAEQTSNLIEKYKESCNGS